jgi:hypothetical protein
MKHVLFLTFLVSAIIGCSKSGTDEKTETTPTVSTTTVTAVSSYSAVSGGNISSDGGSAVTARGVCWSTNTNPTIAGSHTTDSSGTGAFTSTIIGLNLQTKYYLRAYATNAKGTTYGNETSFTTLGSRVYVAGADSNKACIWIDGIKVPLTDGSTTGLAKGVFVSGTDVYVAGSQSGSARVWKNGVATPIPTNSYNDALAIFVSGSEVYVAGVDNTNTTGKPQVWKNGVAVTTQTGPFGGWIESITVSGSDVYGGGAHYQSEYVYTPATWKNGVMTQLSTNQGFVNGVGLLGNDLYAVGQQNDGTGIKARIWKNGVGTNLSEVASSATCVFFSGNDIYVGGYLSGTGGGAAIWKNGVPTIIPGLSVVESIYIKGSDVYAVGTRTINTRLAVAMVKNDVLTPLTDGSGIGRCFSIFVQ